MNEAYYTLFEMILEKLYGSDISWIDRRWKHAFGNTQKEFKGDLHYNIGDGHYYFHDWIYDEKNDKITDLNGGPIHVPMKDIGLATVMEALGPDAYYKDGKIFMSKYSGELTIDYENSDDYFIAFWENMDKKGGEISLKNQNSTTIKHLTDYLLNNLY